MKDEQHDKEETEYNKGNKGISADEHENDDNDPRGADDRVKHVGNDDDCLINGLHLDVVQPLYVERLLLRQVDLLCRDGCTGLNREDIRWLFR